MIDPASRTGRQFVGSARVAAETLEVPGTPIWIDLRKLFSDLEDDESFTSRPQVTLREAIDILAWTH
jgi:hypothetical protein